MLSLEQFEELEVGDQIEVGEVFSELSDEPVVLLAVHKRSNAMEFVATYFGITLGRWVCHLKEGDLRWQVT